MNITHPGSGRETKRSIRLAFTVGMLVISVMTMAGCAGTASRGDVTLIAAPVTASAQGGVGSADEAPPRASAGVVPGQGPSGDPFGVSRIPSPVAASTPAPSSASTPTSIPATSMPAGEPASAVPPVDASGGEAARQPIEVTVAAYRLVDRLVEAGSRLVGEATLPRSLLIWPMRDIGSQRHTLATVQATQAASRRARAEFRGLTQASLEDWADGQGDWAIVAGLRWQPVEEEGPRPVRPSPGGARRQAFGEAELCGVLVDRRTDRILARFAQRVDPATMNLLPAPFHRDLPVVPARSGSPAASGSSAMSGSPATSGSPIGPALCGSQVERPGRFVAALVQSLDLELGLQRYEAGRYATAATAFGRAVELAGNADIEALAGLALALEWARPSQARASWDRLAEAMLDHGRASFTGSIQPLLEPVPDFALAGSAAAEQSLRQQAMRRARTSPEGEALSLRLLRRATVATAGRLRAREQCVIVIGHQDENEEGQISRAPAYERAYALARWLALAGGLDGAAVEIGNVPKGQRLIASATSNIADAWDRRVDVLPVNCRVGDAR